ELFKGYRKSRRLTFDEKVKPVYLELAELLMQQANTVQDGKENKLLEIRDTMELFKAAELQDFFEDECVTAFKSKTKITGMNRTPPHTALIYPILLPESPTLLLIFPDSIKHAPLPVDTETLRQTAKSLRSLLDIRSKQHIKSPNRYRKSASELYNWLIKPVETDLAAREIDTLIIAPDSTLRVIPFSVLLDDNEKFLIEKYALATIPAITLTDFESFERDSINPLLSGLSEGIPPLPNVPNELNAVRTVIGGKILLNKEFTFDNLTSELINEPYSFIVMATHNKFAHTLENTYLQIYDDKGELGKLTMNELEEFISISRFREKKVDLLTLSACETAMGDERAALGLGGIAVKSGAKSAIATLWSVADDAAPLIITEFFRQLKTSDVSKAKALQKAQKKILSEHPDYSHPTYWAPFLLVGNWL
ncbi:MAG: CHAT domain-containing protein, partial [Desulfobacteraceae bacterium]|nr:CHAT domain-containing protein [Desulfobacteraceae bacterium]